MRLKRWLDDFWDTIRWNWQVLGIAFLVLAVLMLGLGMVAGHRFFPVEKEVPVRVVETVVVEKPTEEPHVVKEEVQVEVTRVVEVEKPVKETVVVEVEVTRTVSEPVEVKVYGNMEDCPDSPAGDLYTLIGYSWGNCHYVSSVPDYYATEELTLLEAIPRVWDESLKEGRPHIGRGTKVHPVCKIKGWLLAYAYVPPLGTLQAYMASSGIVPELDRVPLCKNPSILGEPSEEIPLLADLSTWQQEEIDKIFVYLGAGEQRPLCKDEEGIPFTEGWVVVEVPRDFSLFDASLWRIEAGGNQIKTVEVRTEPNVSRFALLLRWANTGEDGRVMYGSTHVCDLYLVPCSP